MTYLDMYLFICFLGYGYGAKLQTQNGFRANTYLSLFHGSK